MAVLGHRKEDQQGLTILSADLRSPTQRSPPDSSLAHEGGLNRLILETSICQISAAKLYTPNIEFQQRVTLETSVCHMSAATLSSGRSVQPCLRGFCPRPAPCAASSGRP